MNAYLVRFLFRVSAQVVRRTWYDVEPYVGSRQDGSSWVTGQGSMERWVSQVVLVPELEDADNYIDGRLDYWADQATRRFFPGMSIRGDWDRVPQAAR